MKNFALAILIFSISTTAIAQSFEIVNDFKAQSELVNSTGVAVADYDQDGDLDIYVVASIVFDKNDTMSWSRLLKNEGEQGFSDVTINAKLINWQAETREGNFGSKLGASWGDYDNDGFPDIFISNYGFDELWHNEGDGTFINVTEDAKVGGCFFCYSTNAVWWDYDQDGDLDLYVSDWLKENRFYRNDGNHVFTDISETTGLNDRRHTFSSLPIDLNTDGLLDIYIINDNAENQFFWNKGNDVFEEATDQLGLSNLGNGMGVDVCDFNNDGYFDIYVTNIHEYLPNPFFVNDGNGGFMDHAADLGIDNTGWGWGTRFFDADHDLDEDLYVVNGFSSSIAEGDRNMFFINHDQSFNDFAKDYEIDNIEWGMGLEVFDYDMDGDIDILVGNRQANLSLYKNTFLENEASDYNWIKIQLQGTISNRNGIGAVVSISCDGIDYYRYQSGVNLFGQSIKPLHFGLADNTQVDSIQVNWPSGLSEIFRFVDSNQLITLIEGTGDEVSSNISTSTMNEEFSDYKIFPNPFHDQVWLQINRNLPAETEFSLVDILGNRVLHSKLNTPLRENSIIQILDKIKIRPGIYFFSLYGNGWSHTSRLIKT